MFGGAVGVASVADEDELVVVALIGEDFGHSLVGDHPIMHVVAHNIWVEEVAVAYLHPDSQWLGRSVWNEVFVKLPCAIRGFRVIRPLLVDVGAGVGEDAVVELGVVPGHDEGA